VYQRQALVSEISNHSIGEAVDALWVAGVVERTHVRDGGAVVVAQRVKLFAGDLRGRGGGEGATGMEGGEGMMEVLE
jgi:hypothetical protein